MVDFKIQFQNKRVGSTFLQNCIDSHTELAGVDEVFVNVAKKPGMRKSGFVPFLRSDVNNPKDYIDYILKKTHEKKKAMSIKVMYNQILHHNGLFQYIKGNNIPMIHLMRRNLVKQVISGLTAARTNHDPIAITPDNFFHRVKQVKEENIHWSARLKSNIKLVLYYEDIIGERLGDRTYLNPLSNKAICDFFGVEEQMMYSTTKKKNKEDISVYLPNIENIKKRFKGTEFEWMMGE